MALRNYANAPATTLSSGCTNSATSIVLVSVSGLPVSYPYILILDRGQAVEEVVLVTSSGGGTTLNVTRGYDSTTGFSHSAGALVEHGISAIDPREANTHVNATGAVHGLSGSVVGTTDTQTLSNKTMSVASNTFSGLTASRFVTSGAGGNMDSTLTKAIPAGVVVGDTDTQTLTNKTISADNNTLSGIAASSFVLSNASGNIDGAAAQKAIPSGDVVGTSDTQTLTNKTLTAPEMTDPNALDLDVNNSATGVTALNVNAISGTTAAVQRWLSNAAAVANVDVQGRFRGANTTGGPTRTSGPYASMTKTTNQSVNDNTNTPLTWTSVIEETDATMGDAASAEFVTPIAGIYTIMASATWAANATGRRLLRLQVDLAQKDLDNRDAPPDGQATNHVFWRGRLDAGDVIDFEVLQNSGGNLDVLNADASVIWEMP